MPAKPEKKASDNVTGSVERNLERGYLCDPLAMWSMVKGGCSRPWNETGVLNLEDKRER